MSKYLNALPNMEQRHSGTSLSFLYPWMAKKLKLKCEIHHMGESIPNHYAVGNKNKSIFKYFNFIYIN